MKIALLGCTGLVGRKMLSLIEKRGFFADEFYLYATKKSVGTPFELFGKTYFTEEADEAKILSRRADIAFLFAGKEPARRFAPAFIKSGAVVIDNSSEFRMAEGVPLVVPEVNGRLIKKGVTLFANPNCSTIQAVIVLNVMNAYKPIKRVVYSTYQAVSGAGKAAVDDLKNGINGISPQKFKKEIFSNCIPKVDEFSLKGYTFEEEKMINETRKILDLPRLAVTATCVRVPVFNCHSESVNVEFFEKIELDEVKKLLFAAKGIKLYPDDDYPTPRDADGDDEIFVGRLREDFSVPFGLNFWCVGDNLLKGAALNAIQIAEKLRDII